MQLNPTSPTAKAPQLHIATFTHSPGKALLKITVGKLKLFECVFSLAKFETPEKENALLQSIAADIKSIMATNDKVKMQSFFQNLPAHLN